MRPVTDIEGRDAMRTVASLAALAAALGIPGVASAQDASTQAGAAGEAAAEVAGEDGRRIFPAAFFEADRPSTALDMVRRVPGFGIDGGSGARGLGGTGGNVLIDGARPTSKDQSIDSILAGIPAAQVERIELLEGAAAGAAASGQSLVVNVVRRAGSRPTSSVSVQLNQHENGFIQPEIDLTHSRTVGGFSLELSAGYAYDNYNNLSGFEGFRDAQGRWLELGPNDDRRRFQDWNASARLSGTWLGNKVSLNAQARTFESRRTWSHQAFVPGAPAPFRVDSGREGDEGDSWELGAGLERTVGPWTGRVNLLAKQRESANFSTAGFNPVGTAPRFSRFRSEQVQSEQIARATLARTFGAHAIEFGGEFAVNELDLSNRFGTGDGITFTETINPREINDTTVSEDRWEAFISDSWTISDRLTLDGTLTGEWSTITQTGDARKERSFFYLKPRLSASWKPADGWTIRGRVERQVGQLDFGAFAFSASVGDGTGRVGNTDLKPDQAWVSEVAIERRWGQRGVASLTLVNEDISDAFAAVPLDTNGDGRIDGEARGNLPSANRRGFTLDMTLPLEQLVPGLEVSVTWRWRESSIRDPLTGRERELDGWDGGEFNPSFVQRFLDPQWAWGVWYWQGDRSVDFSASQSIEWSSYSSWGAWIETKAFDGWTLEAGFEDPQGQVARRERTIWTDDRRNPVFARQQYRERSFDGSVYVEARADF